MYSINRRRRIVIAASFLAIFGAGLPASAAASSDKLADKVVQAMNAPAGAKVSVSFDKGHGIVDLLVLPGTTVTETDYKVMSMLAGKSVMEHSPETALVKVRLHTGKGPQVIRQITISKGDVVAFGNKSITQEDMLKSLEVVDLPGVQTSYRPASARRVATPTTGLRSYERIAAPPVPSVQFSFYQDPTTGISFSYPVGWQVQRNPDKDSLVKIEGNTSDGSVGSIALSASHEPGMSLESFPRMYEEFVLKKQSGYKDLGQKKILFGKDWRLAGDLKNVSFDAGGLSVNERLVFFGQGDRVYALTFLAPAKYGQNLSMIFDHILGSVTMPGEAAQIAEASATTSIPLGNRLASYHCKNTNLVVAYPRDWQVEETPEDNVLVKMSGTDPQGHQAGLSVRAHEVPPGMSLEQCVGTVEEEFYSKQKGYRRISQQQANFGSMSGLPGITQEVNFDVNGFPATQNSAYFMDRDHNHWYILQLTCFGWTASEMHSLFSKILAGTSHR